jgi:hypothetical protein
MSLTLLTLLTLLFCELYEPYEPHFTFSSSKNVKADDNNDSTSGGQILV